MKNLRLLSKICFFSQIVLFVIFLGFYIFAVEEIFNIATYIICVPFALAVIGKLVADWMVIKRRSNINNKITKA